MGAAKDIVEHVGVPRYAFSDVPLGNSAGLPNDSDSQRLVLETALTVLAVAPGPRTTVQTAATWPTGNHNWKADFNNLGQLTDEVVAKARASFEHQKDRARESNS